MIQIPTQKLKEFLLKEELIKERDFNELLLESKRMGQDISTILISRGFITLDYFYNFIALYLNVEMANLAVRAVDENILKKLSEDLARQKRVIIFAQEPNGAFDAAMEDPGDLEAIKFLEKHLGVKIKPYLATPEDLNKGFASYNRRLAEDFDKIIKENVKSTLKKQISESAEKTAQELPIVAIVDNMVSYAISLRASDVHIEILEDEILIRYRIDGILHEIIKLPKEIYPAVTARIKLLAGLKIDEHLKPQDGRFRYRTSDVLLDIRVATIPVFYGEKIELRLLPAAQKPLALKELGILDDTRTIIEENIKKSYGMVLICGPTGSGKTTTLYSILNILNKPEVNIVTIEDPIEYDIKYLNQTQINLQAGITFASGLRSILRQDPNIIMVGEIRDEETADIAINSALTGHLVLSSVHTNDAPTAVPRLLDMKVPNFLVAAVLNVIIAQRLVRKICLDCIESFPVDSAMSESLSKNLKDANSESRLSIPKILYHGKGCSACNNSGFKGRIGIYEALDVNEEIRKLIIAPNFSLDTLRITARKNGMLTMFEDGLRKAELGMTTIEEILRVIKE